jgi:hypothetical protein
MTPSPSISYSWKAPVRHLCWSCTIYVRPMGRTFQLFIHLPSTSHAQCAYKLFEINLAVLVHVKHAKNVFRELYGVAKRKELLVDSREFIFAESASGTVFEKAFVPVQMLWSFFRVARGRVQYLCASWSKEARDRSQTDYAPLLQLLLVDCSSRHALMRLPPERLVQQRKHAQ